MYRYMQEPRTCIAYTYQYVFTCAYSTILNFRAGLYSKCSKLKLVPQGKKNPLISFVIQDFSIFYRFTVLQGLGQKYKVCDCWGIDEVVKVHLDDSLALTQFLTSDLKCS